MTVYTTMLSLLAAVRAAERERVAIRDRLNVDFCDAAEAEVRASRKVVADARKALTDHLEANEDELVALGETFATV